MSAFSMRIGIGLYLYIFILSILFYFRLFYLYTSPILGYSGHLQGLVPIFDPWASPKKVSSTWCKTKTLQTCQQVPGAGWHISLGPRVLTFAWTIFSGNWSVAAGVAEATGNMCGFCDVREHPSAATERWKIPLRYVYFHPTKAWKCLKQVAHPKNIYLRTRCIKFQPRPWTAHAEKVFCHGFKDIVTCCAVRLIFASFIKSYPYPKTDGWVVPDPLLVYVCHVHANSSLQECLAQW